MNLIVSEILKTAQNSANKLRERISDVKYCVYRVGDQYSKIEFILDGNKWIGELKGRNESFCLSLNDAKADKGLALRVFLDGHANKIT